MTLSTFYITLNTNQTTKVIPASLLKEVWAFYYENIESFLKFKLGGDASKIQDISSEVACEIGKVYNRVHIHALIRIEHTTNLQIDTELSRKWFEESLGVDGLHLHVKYIKDNLFNIRRYLEKNPV